MTAVPDQPGLPERGEYRDRWSALHGGYDPASSALAGGWLSFVELLARPLACRGISPNALTGAGVVLAAAAIPAGSLTGRLRLVSSAAVIGSGVLDNLDGSVAILTGRASAWGYLLDSLADRAADACSLAALAAAGAPRGVALAGAGCITTLEYARARAGNAGFGEIGIVTVGERPSRVIIAAVGLALAGLFPGQAGRMATIAAAAVAGVSAVGAGQFLRVAARRLRPDQAGPMSPATALADNATNGSPPPG